MTPEKVNLEHIRTMKERGEPIVMLTAYDALTAKLIDESGADLVLVGDSAGMVVHGFESTLPVTMDMMILHCQAVRRGVKRALVVGDMPFMSYQLNTEEAKRNAARFLAQGGADAVKIEGGREMAPTIRALVDTGIAVMGHIGLLPQHLSALGRFKVQGKTLEAAQRLIEDAKAVEAAGAFSMVLETVPARLAGLISKLVSIPTIGIGAGVDCDGQVLVTPDLLGMSAEVRPKHAKRYAELAQVMTQAFTSFRDEVRARAFPGDKNSFTLSDEVWDTLRRQYLSS
ncbi:MAG TPA: 3-methyl-2-oxobutanoate hydroxymethyltransferase [Candidatus Bipolaricaulota bacterium]